MAEVVVKVDPGILLVHGMNSRSLHYAPPDFLSSFVALMKSLRLSL
jgi:hypothetical protein